MAREIKGKRKSETTKPHEEQLAALQTGGNGLSIPVEHLWTSWHTVIYLPRLCKGSCGGAGGGGGEGGVGGSGGGGGSTKRRTDEE